MQSFTNWLVSTTDVIIPGLRTVLVQQQLQTDAAALLNEESLITRTVLIALVPVIVAFSFIVFVFYRAKREAFFKQKETELKLSIADGELKALRAQINPHFIFNCLNSIHHYMHQHDVIVAGTYLVKFSQLIRHVLESSTQRMVPLNDEIEANRLYIELEQLRMDQAFTYDIQCKTLDCTKIHVPPMLIQPFVENAIWHGMTTGGTLEIHFHAHYDNHVQCIIRDTGQRAVAKSEIDLSHGIKKTSLGMILMRERFDTLNQVNGTQADFTFGERSDGVIGKQATLIIPYED